MRKPRSLRAHLTAALRSLDLARNPDRLHMSITDCTPVVSARPGTSVAVEFRYTLRIALLDFTGDPAEIVFPLLIWVGRHQNDLILRAPGGPGVQMEVEFLDDKKVDVLIDLPLTEVASQQIASAPDPAPIVWPDEPVPMALERPGALLHRILDEGGGLIAGCEHPVAP